MSLELWGEASRFQDHWHTDVPTSDSPRDGAQIEESKGMKPPHHLCAQEKAIPKAAVTAPHRRGPNTEHLSFHGPWGREV